MYKSEGFALFSAGVKTNIYYSKDVVWHKIIAGILKKCDLIQQKRLRISSTAAMVSCVCGQKSAVCVQ